MLLGIFLAFIVLVCFALAGVVLLQRSEGGALGMGGGPSGFLTTRGAGDLLTRTTWILGGTLFALCLAMAIVQGRLNKGASVVDRVKINPASIPTGTFPNAVTGQQQPAAPPAPAADGFGPPAPTVNVAPAAAPNTVAPGAVTVTPTAPAARPAPAARGAAPVQPPRPHGDRRPGPRRLAAPDPARHQHRPHRPGGEDVGRPAQPRSRHARAQDIRHADAGDAADGLIDLAPLAPA